MANLTIDKLTVKAGTLAIDPERLVSAIVQALSRTALGPRLSRDLDFLSVTVTSEGNDKEDALAQKIVGQITDRLDRLG